MKGRECGRPEAAVTVLRMRKPGSGGILSERLRNCVYSGRRFVEGGGECVCLCVRSDSLVDWNLLTTPGDYSCPSY